MKKRTITVTISLVVLLTTSCKKENDAPKFSATGYWTGKVYLYNAVLVNGSNGESKLYAGTTNNDTATALLKLYGQYQSNEKSFDAKYYAGNDDTAYLKADKMSAGLMSGYYRTKNTPGANFPFEFKK
ncbi:MAG: hypothetical protein KF825_04120 [Ferruginibacter sp.]|nr:hypothetical protein [Ferruginibacter sp.]